MGIFDRLQRKWEELRHGDSWASPFWVFLVFFVVMVAQNRYVFLYHDDYGYASLNYAMNYQFLHGHAFNLAQLTSFLSQHYTHWGGRVIPIGVALLALRWGVWPFRILQSIVLTMILVSSYHLLSKFNPYKISRWLIAFALCCCYGLIDVKLHRNGTYWDTASAVYVWPLLALFAAAAIHIRLEEGRRAGWLWLALGGLYFLTGSSQEQIGLLGIVFVSGLIVADVWLKKRRYVLYSDAISLVCILAGFAFLSLAPGNFVRMNSRLYASFLSMGLAERLSLTIPGILEVNLGQQNQTILMLWAWLSAAAMGAQYRSGKGLQRLYFLACLLCAGFAILLTVALLPSLSAIESWIFRPPFSLAHLLFWVGFLCAVSLALVMFCLDNRLYVLIALFAGGLASQAVMILSPTLNMRSSLMFLFVLFPVLAVMLVELSSQAQALVKLALLVMFIAAAFNTLLILRGYAANSPVLESNDRVLRQAAQSIHNGAAIQSVKLHKLPNDLYAGEMPYTPEYAYINLWIKEYYDLPLDINLIWK